MDTVRVKSYAKLNLTLHITGAHGGFHMLDSIVTSVDLYDLIVLKKRRDKLVSVVMHGMDSESIPFEDNNAAKAAQAFVERYDTRGVDITVYKNIPMGLGLGGSSADAAGVLNGLFSLYNIADATGKKLLADGVGSDTRYMLSGGYARLYGRGDEVKPIDSRLKLNFLLLAPHEGVSTAQCYRAFDGIGAVGGDSDSAERAIMAQDKGELAKHITNALTPAAQTLCPDVSEAAEQLAAFDPLAVCMTGSGSGVYALFETPEFCAYAQSRYVGRFKTYLLKTHLPKR